MKTIFLSSLAVILLTCFVSCSDSVKNKDIIVDLKVERENIIITKHQPAYLKILSGNKDYTVVSSNEMIVEGTPGISLKDSYDIIALSGKKNGETTITVTDNISGQHTTINIKVVDAYMVLSCSGHSPVIDLTTNNKEIGEIILNEVNDKASISAGNIMVLLKNETHTFCLFNSKSDYEDGIKAFEGKYEFLLKDKIPYLTYEYVENGKDKTLTTRISNEPSNLTSLNIISNFFNLNWDITSLKSTRSSMIGKNFLETFEDFTAQYKADYEIVNSVLLKSAFEINTPSISDLPEDFY